MEENSNRVQETSSKKLITILVATLIMVTCCFILAWIGPYVASSFNEDLKDNGQCKEIVANHLQSAPITEPFTTFPLPTVAETINLVNIADVALIAEEQLPNSLLSWQMSVNAKTIEFSENPEWRASVQVMKSDNSHLAQIDTYPSEATIIRVCDLASGTQIKAWTSDETTNALAFTPDGQSLLVNEGRGRISIYNTENYTRQSRWDVRDRGEKWRNTRQMTISPDGKIAAFAVREPESLAMTIRLWYIEDEVEVASLAGHTDTMVSLTFTPDGALLISHGMDDAVRLWGIP